MSICTHIDSYLKFLTNAPVSPIEDEDPFFGKKELKGIVYDFKDIRIAEAIKIIFQNGYHFPSDENPYNFYYNQGTIKSTKSKIYMVYFGDENGISQQLDSTVLNTIILSINNYMKAFASQWIEGRKKRPLLKKSKRILSSSSELVRFSKTVDREKTAFENILVGLIADLRNLRYDDFSLRVSISDITDKRYRSEFTIAGKTKDVEDLFKAMQEEFFFQPKSLKDLAVQCVSQNLKSYDLSSVPQDVRDFIKQ